MIRPTRLPAGAIVVAAAVLGGVAPADAQTFQGRVVDDTNEAPVPTALVQLLDEEGETVGLSVADSAGAYRIEAPEPGIYRLAADRLGFELVETPLLDARAADGIYPIDLAMQPAPVEISGLTIDARRLANEEADRQIRLMMGVSTASLRHQPIGYEAILRHVWANRSVAEAIRASDVPGLVVTYGRSGPCFSLRARRCLPVYFNGLRLRGNFIEDLPLETIYRIVVVSPTDAVNGYPGGAILLFTEEWLR